MLPRSYLVRPTDVAHVETRIDFRASGVELREAWNQLLQRRLAGDELWELRPAPGFVGLQGVALVRDNLVVFTFVEAES